MESNEFTMIAEHIALHDEYIDAMTKEGMLTKEGQRYRIVPDTPKYVKCPKGHWTKTWKGGDFSLLFCRKCKVNYINVWNTEEERMLKAIHLTMKGKATNITPEGME